MNKETRTLKNDVDRLAEDAGTFLSSNFEVAGDRFTSAMDRGRERGREIYSHAVDRALEGTKSADAVVRDHLYLTIAVGASIGIGIGALVSYILSSRCVSCKQS